MRFSVLVVMVLSIGGIVAAAVRYQATPEDRSTVFPPSAIPSLTRTLVEGTTLVYVSDYFSFVGADAQGHVAFALDNNRGRDGEQYQAEHFLVLHDEQQGWIELTGKGFYDNTQHQLYEIPNSPFFQFQGTPQSGLVIWGQHEPLCLAIEPLVMRETRGNAERLFAMGSAAAVLSWGNRQIPGRVIYEYLVMKNANRLSRRFSLSMLFGGADFQGLYLLGDSHEDVYVHGSHNTVLQPLMGPVLGFHQRHGQPEVMTDLVIDVTSRAFAYGLFSWPTAWEVRWNGATGPAVLVVQERDRRSVVNWVLGGFAMSIVTGDLFDDGQHHAVYGLGEMIR